MSDPPLVGEVALVTGASRGIGAAIAAKLRALGATVETAERETGFDLADAEQARRAVERLDRLDILVCNAGRIVRGPLLETTLDDWRSVIDLNLTTPFLMAQAAARKFTAQGTGGRIVHVASMRAFTVAPEAASYAASKGGLVQLTKAQAIEWAPLGIRVNAIAPGWVETELTAELRASAAAPGITARIPAGRWASPAEIADAAAFLVLPESRYVYGHVLAVDGGYLAR